MITIAAIHNLMIYQVDVKKAFLNGDLEEEIYIDQPKGFTMLGNEHKVCKLLKSLYGLKQAPRQWHEKFDQCLLSNGFRTNESDKCIYYRTFEDAHIITCLYVDGLLIFGPNMDIITAAKMLLKNNFDMKDLGEANVILGKKISRTSNGIFVDQSHYIENFLKKYNYFDCKPASISFDSNVHLFPTKGENDIYKQKEYAGIIGSLRYVIDCTRLDIAYVVGILARFTSKPNSEHWNAMTQLIRYVKRIVHYGLLYRRYLAVLEGYSDTSWSTLLGDSLSTMGYVFTIGG